MPDTERMAIVSRVITEHQVIHHNVKLMGESMNDLEALLDLEHHREEWTPGKTEGIAEIQDKLVHTLLTMEHGLQSHFGYEEKYLFPLMGELVTEGLVLDHQHIARGLAAAAILVRETSLADLPAETLLAKEKQIQLTIHSLYQMIEKHATTENAIIVSMNRALQERTNQQREGPGPAAR